MLNRRKRPLGNEKDCSAYISQDITCSGTLRFQGTVYCDGQILGDIESDGVLILGQGSYVTGQVRVGSLYSNGNVEGNVVVKGETILHKESRISGELRTALLSIEKGALIEGEIKTAADNERGQGKIVEIKEDMEPIGKTA